MRFPPPRRTLAAPHRSTRERWMKTPLAGALVALAAVVSAPAALAAPATATFLGPIHVSGKKATLSVRYSCPSGQNVWVSAKQLASGGREARLTKEGSSKAAA